jgi:hypothetical protein
MPNEADKHFGINVYMYGMYFMLSDGALRGQQDA